MRYPSYSLSHTVIAWDDSNYNEADDYQGSYYDQFALTPLTPAPYSPLQFDVRCRYRILTENDLPLFLMLVEVVFIIHPHELSLDKLVEYTEEAREITEEEHNKRKVGSKVSHTDVEFNEIPLDVLEGLLRGK